MKQKSLIEGLSPEKRTLLARRATQLRGDAEKASKEAKIQRQNRTEGGGMFPLSFAQERLWLLDQIGVRSRSYVEVIGMRVRGPLKIDLLEKVFEELVRRHEVLRTTFEEREGKPVQVVRPTMSVNVEVLAREARGE